VKTSLLNIKTVLVPIGVGAEAHTALTLAQSLAEEVVLVGIVPIGAGESISAGAQAARKVRKHLLSLSRPASVRFKSTVIVSETPWQDLQRVIINEKPELLLVEWQASQTFIGLSTT